MIKNILWLLNHVRENILERFTLPELNMSYWEFCIYLAIVGIVITVLVNSVKLGGSLVSNSNKENSYHNVLRNRERVKADERSKIYGSRSSSGSSNSTLDLDAAERFLNGK